MILHIVLYLHLNAGINPTFTCYHAIRFQLNKTRKEGTVSNQILNFLTGSG